MSEYVLIKELPQTDVLMYIHIENFHKRRPEGIENYMNVQIYLSHSVLDQPKYDYLWTEHIIWIQDMLFVSKNSLFDCSKTYSCFIFLLSHMTHFSGYSCVGYENNQLS